MLLKRFPTKHYFHCPFDANVENVHTILCILLPNLSERLTTLHLCMGTPIQGIDCTIIDGNFPIKATLVWLWSLPGMTIMTVSWGQPPTKATSISLHFARYILSLFNRKIKYIIIYIYVYDSLLPVLTVNFHTYKLICFSAELWSMNSKLVGKRSGRWWATVHVGEPCTW